jgi:glycosyltransferase involved in cell wall biosynthesis
LKIIITDDGFAGWSGDNARYNLAVLDELEQRGFDCKIFAHHNISQFRDLASKAKPTFKYTATRFPLNGKIWPRFIYKFTRAFLSNTSHLFDLLQKVTFCVDDKDLLLIADFSPRTSIAYSLWLFYLTVLRKKLGVVIILHGAPRNYWYYLWALLKTLAHFHRITLAAIIQPIADICSKQTSLECRVLPNPQTLLVPDSRSPQDSGRSEVALAFLGIAIVEKGFDALVDEISFLRDMLNEKKISLTVQCNIVQGSPVLNKAKDKLLSLARSVTGLKVIEGTLPMEQFFDVLYSADILIFPYRPEIYKYNQSGVFTQALTLGKIVIVTEGTFIASELARYGSGIVYKFGVPGALTEAIKTAANNIVTMKEKAQRTKNLYYQIHNRKRYVDLLLELRI